MKKFKIILLLILLFYFSFVIPASEKTLDYQCRYDCQTGEPDHLMDAIGINSHRAIVAGNRGLALLDIDPQSNNELLPYFDRLTGVNARDLYLKDSTYVFVNIHRGESQGQYGFAVVKLNSDKLSLVKTIEEFGVLYEKMCVQGNYLYIAAHNKGFRIYDIQNPENTVLTGRLDEGFVDAFAVDVANDTAYVADGAGGLKIVDVSDKSQPVLLDGENLETAAGTAESIAIKNGYIFMASGGAGIAVYKAGDLKSRQFYPVGGCAEDMCWVGDYLAVSNMHGLVILRPNACGELAIVARENAHRRGSSAKLRISMGIGVAPGNRLLCANWNFMDVYKLVSADSSNQPDINCNVQRIRFSPEGGTKQVTVKNSGRGVLNITEVRSLSSVFTTDFTGASLLPGDSVFFDIHYVKSSNDQDASIIGLKSNDPDEDILPIQVFGKTSFLDPGEDAVDFTLPSYIIDPVTGQLTEELFTLSEHKGKVIWFSVYASW